MWTELEDTILDIVRDRKKISFLSLFTMCKCEAEPFEECISKLIDSNQLSEFHERGVKFIKLGLSS